MLNKWPQEEREEVCLYHIPLLREEVKVTTRLSLALTDERAVKCLKLSGADTSPGCTHLGLHSPLQALAAGELWEMTLPAQTLIASSMKQR